MPVIFLYRNVISSPVKTMYNNMKKTTFAGAPDLSSRIMKRLYAPNARNFTAIVSK